MSRNKGPQNRKASYSASGAFCDTVIAVTVEKHRYKSKTGRAETKRRKTNHGSH